MRLLRGRLNLPVLSMFEPDLVASGVSTLDASVRGSLERPQVTGRMEIRDGRGVGEQAEREAPADAPRGEPPLLVVDAPEDLAVAAHHVEDPTVGVEIRLVLRLLTDRFLRHAVRAVDLQVTFGEGVAEVVQDKVVLRVDAQRALKEFASWTDRIAAGEQLQALERRILAHDPTLAAPTRERPVTRVAPAAPPPLPSAQARVRKTVTIVFADLVGFTEIVERLDPEEAELVRATLLEALALEDAEAEAEAARGVA